MSNIPAPSYNSSLYDVYNQRTSVGGPGAATDFGGDYGLEGNDGSQSPEMMAWFQEALHYHQMYQSLLATGNLDPASRSQVMDYDSQLMGWFDQYGFGNVGGNTMAGGSNWDPLTGQMGGSIIPGMGQDAPQGAPVNQTQISSPIDFQDNTHVVTDQGANCQIVINDQDTDSRTIDAYQGNVSLVIPSNAANVKVTYVPDDAAPGHMMVQVSYTSNGKTQTIKLHKADRPNFDFNIQAADPTAVDLTDPALVTALTTHSSLCTVSELGSASLADQQGDLPTRMEGDTRVYDVAGDVNLYPVPDGSNKKTSVTASGTVTIHPNSNSEWYTVNYDAATKQYTVQVYTDAARTKLKETITVDGSLTNTKLQFACDPSRMNWGNMASVTDPTQVDSTKAGANKVSFTSSGASNTELPKDATPPDSASGDTATWNTWSDVNAYAADGYVNHNITAPGTVTIHGNSFSDTFEIKDYQAGPPQTWTILVHKDGKLDAANTESFTVKGGANTKVVLAAMDASSIVKSDGTPETDQAKLGSVQVQSGDSTTGATGNSGVDTSNDTEPSDKQTYMGKNIWTYTGQSATVHATYAQDYNYVNVTGDFNLVLSKTDHVEVKKEKTASGETVYMLTVTNKDGTKKTTYEINRHVKHINLQSDNPADFNPLNVSLVGDAATDDKIMLQGTPASSSTSALDGYADALSQAGTTNLHYDNHGELGGEDKWAKQTANDIGAALMSGNWDDVQADLNKVASIGNDGIKNDFAEFLFQYLTEQLGGGSAGRQKLKAILGQMPSSVTTKWVQCLNAASGELNNNDASDHDGAEAGWTHQQTVDFINSAASAGGAE
ncbi:MAG: hypothetical protein U1F57_10305 [bacterium]